MATRGGARMGDGRSGDGRSMNGPNRPAPKQPGLGWPMPSQVTGTVAAARGGAREGPGGAVPEQAVRPGRGGEIDVNFTYVHKQ